MGFVSPFNCKQSEKLKFLCYVIPDQVPDRKVIYRGPGIRVPWVDCFQKIGKRGDVYSGAQEYVSY